MSNTAIILGAGNGTRMKIEKSKLLLEIGGKTVIERSVEAFLKISDIDEIIVTLREEDVEAFSSLISDERVTFVIGGATRQKSVKNAIQTIDDAELVIIHDGARPLIKTEDIEKTIRAARDFGAASVGVKVKDTIKIVDADCFVESTPERSTLFSVQTPQIFNFSLYKKALEKAENENMDFTDDCQLIEYMGHKVKMVEGSYSNIKITTAEDIPLAESLL
ncbi:MAG: 2-C-methyl-D-erythritol 4-phosphate cytidylyltransferase [Eubacterium sp.]|nr:2-C-methyl-D-erythritol 4-phosphate cytidylyltransferase [Eubacterium sp.]